MLSIFNTRYISDENVRYSVVNGYIVAELACSIFQKAIEQDYPQMNDLSSYRFVSLMMANTIVRGEPYYEYQGKEIEIYRSIINKSAMTIVCNSMVTYLMSKFAVVGEMLKEVVLNLIRIWLNNDFVEIQTYTKCVIAINSVDKDYVLGDDIVDVDTRSMFEYLRSG